MAITIRDKKFFDLEDYDGEIWKPMNEFGNEFFVSNYGRIKRAKRTWGSGRKLATIKTVHESIVKQRIVPAGYMKVTICFNGVKKSYAPHRLVAIHFLDNPNNLPQVNHIDGDKLNNNLDNLEWVTVSENIRHSVNVLHKHHKHGGFLNYETVEAIRKYKEEHPEASYGKISKLFGYSYNRIYGIFKKNTYATKK